MVVMFVCALRAWVCVCVTTMCAGKSSQLKCACTFPRRLNIFRTVCRERQPEIFKYLDKYYFQEDQIAKWGLHLGPDGWTVDALDSVNAVDDMFVLRRYDEMLRQAHECARIAAKMSAVEFTPAPPLARMPPSSSSVSMLDIPRLFKKKTREEIQ